MAETILTRNQLKALELFKKDGELPDVFYLTGGTALTEFYLKHRTSDDLDFFTDGKEFSFSAVEKFIKDLSLEISGEARFQKLYDRHMFFLSSWNVEPELKIEFTIYPFAHLSQLKKLGRLQVDSMLDIAANKLMAMIERFEPKDFVDLYFLLQEKFMIGELVEAVNKKFGFKIEPLTLGQELMKVRRVSFLPKMRKELSIPELQNFFLKLARDLRPQVIE